MKCFQINLKKRLAFVSVLMFVLMTSCIDKYERIDKYQRPEWLTGKLYTQIATQENMLLFSQMMVDTEYDELIDKTGTYAAFVPNDSVMRIYLNNKFGTTNLEDIPLADKETIVKFHILQMPWNSEQLQSLSAKGWIDPESLSNNEPTAFKRKSLYREPNKTYSIVRTIDGDDIYEEIVPESATKRIVYNETYKHVPLFFDGFLQAADLTGQDYTFYYDRPYEAGNIYFANAKVLGQELFAENGFLYEIDDVVDFIPNAEEIMQGGEYSTFLNLIYEFPEFSKNETATNNQEGVEDGLEVPDLYDLSYDLPVDIHNEKVSTANETLEDNMGILVPTDQAMATFFDTYFKGGNYNTWDDVPKALKEIVLENHIGQKALYKTDLENGFYNELGDEVTYDLSKINEKVYGSNCSFIGVDEVLEPLYFKRVSAPLLLNNMYSAFFLAYSSTGLLPTLKKTPAEYSFFMVDDQTLAQDSTLMMEELNGRYYLKTYDRSDNKFMSLLTSSEFYSFRRRLYGHIGIEPILNNGSTKEFIETIDGRHIQVYQKNGQDLVDGGLYSEYGFNSDSAIDNTFSRYDNKFPVDNGTNYECDAFIRFQQNRLYTLLEGTKYLNFLDDLGMADIPTEQTFFDDPTERYTLFLPSDAALTAAQVDTLSTAQLKELIQFHIVRGDFIFTDGKAGSGTYKTYNNKSLKLNTLPDDIQVLNASGDLITNVLYSTKANQIATYTSNSDEAYYTTNVVIQPIDTVIYPY